MRNRPGRRGPKALQRPDERRPAGAAAGARVAAPAAQLGGQLVGEGDAVAIAGGDDGMDDHQAGVARGDVIEDVKGDEVGEL